MNWTNEPWFINLPDNTQQEIISDYQNGNITDNDISKLKGIYSPKVKSKSKPMSTLDKIAFNPLSAMAKAGNSGGSLFNVMGTGLTSTGKEIKDVGVSGIAKLFDPFFNCFKSNFFIDNYSGHMFVVYAIGKNIILNNDKTINLNDPNVIQLIPKVVQGTFDDYMPTMANIIWSEGLSTGLFSTIASGVRNTMFYTTDKVLSLLKLQTYNILIPSMKSMSNIFSYDYIKDSFKNNNLSQFGISIKNDVINTNISILQDKMSLIEEMLKKDIMKSRDECINKMKNNITKSFGESIQEAMSQFGNPALDTLNKQLNPTLKPTPSTSTNSTLSPTTSGFGGLGSAEDGQQKFYDILGQAGAKYGLDNTTMTNMGFGQQEESPAAKLGMPKDQHDSFNKWFGPAFKEFMKNNPAPTQSSTENIDDLWSNISQ